MDEKMKDSVKITVIATGFREAADDAPPHQETRDLVCRSARRRDGFSRTLGVAM